MILQKLMLCTFRKHLLNILTQLLILSLTSCISNAHSDSKEKMTFPASTATPPPGVTLEQIVPDTETKEWAYLAIQENPGGTLIGMDAAYKGTYPPPIYSMFYVALQDDFVGQAYILNGDLQPREFVFVCLLDHRQIPCESGAKTPEQVTLEAATEHIIPVHLAPLAQGVHDFDIMVVRDPYEGIFADDLEPRTFIAGNFLAANILAGGSLEFPRISPVVIPASPSKLTEEGTMAFAVTANSWLYDKESYPTPTIPAWLDIEGNRGERIKFYIHFDGNELRGNKTRVIMAFLNYEQVPLYYEDTPYMPLYIERIRKTTQSVPVQLQLPDEPGVYELVVAVRSHAFELQEHENGESFNLSDIESSSLVRIRVK